MDASTRESSPSAPDRIRSRGLALALLGGLAAGCGEAAGAADDPSSVGDAGRDHAQNVDAPREDARVEAVTGPADDAARSGPAVLCLGDSLTAGYGLDPDDAWPALLQRRVDALGWPHTIVNAGSSGETTTGGLRRLDWVLRSQPDVAAVVLALGGNDGLRGISVELMESNLEALIEGVRSQRPGAVVVLAGMQSPPNMGADYTDAFRAVFPRLAARHDTALVPFLLEGVGGEPDMNQADGIHPNVEGQARVADNVWAVLGPLLAADG